VDREGSRKRTGWIGGAVAILVLAALYCSGDRAEVRSILKIWWLPSSVRVLQCNSPFTTDILAACYLEIEPTDFDRLLRGRAFISGSTGGRIHGQPNWRTLGEDFEIEYSFYYDLRYETEYGGHVLVVADRQRRHVVVDLYIE